MRSCKIKSDTALYKQANQMKQIVSDFIKIAIPFFEKYGIFIRHDIHKKYNIDITKYVPIHYIKYGENTCFLHDIHSFIYSIEYVLNHFPFHLYYSPRTEQMTIEIPSGNVLFDFLDAHIDELFSFNSTSYNMSPQCDHFVLCMKVHLLDLNDLMIDI
jgi:hypothetical protein